MANSQRRKSARVAFEKGIPVSIMGIDGTWRRHCSMEDVSQTGARLRVDDSIQGLNLREFFLLLSSTGLGGVDTYRIHKMIAARVTTAR
jgi:hypothetical protein